MDSFCPGIKAVTRVTVLRKVWQWTGKETFALVLETSRTSLWTQPLLNIL
jgi:hypothetical protein